MRINIEANAEELAKLKDLGFLVEEFTDVICDLLDRDLPVPLPNYTVTLNEPSAIQAQLVAALKGLDDSFCSINEFSTKEERHQARMNLIAARAAVAAAGAQP